jgi:hypothetical protein
MTAPGNAALRDVARALLTSTDRSRTDSAVLAAAVRRAHASLSQVMAPLIGQTGTNSLSARAVHLARAEYPWLAPTRHPDSTETVFGLVAASLERQAPDVALEAGTAVLATLAGLLATFIGESLTLRLLRKSWPDGFPESGSGEGKA